MKKLMIISALLCSPALFAQKANKGNITTEVGVAVGGFFTPVNSTGINLRYFLSQTLAVGLGVNMNSSNATENFFENADGTGKTGTFESKFATNAITLGAQKHFAGGKRISPFIGLGISFGGIKMTETGTNSDGDDFVNDYSESSDMAGSIMSVDFGLGMDYWVTDALFVGLVYNPLSFSSMNIKESTKTMKSGSNTTKEVTGAVKVSGLSTTGGFPLFRVGWRF